VVLLQKKNKGEKISNGLQFINGEERPQCVVCGEVLANIVSMEEICVGTY
jgi:hypothetical protein